MNQEKQNRTSNNNPFGEVIESSLQMFLAQSWRWDTVPEFGSLVATTLGTRTVFGVVHQVQTGSIDPSRYPFAYQKTEEELRRDQPQIFEFLKTTFSSLVIGYQEKGRMVYLLSSEPVKIHSMVRSATKQECAQFFCVGHYWSLIFGASNHVFNIDELFLAVLHYQERLGILHQEKLEQSLTTFSLMTGNDYRRLKLLLLRVQSFLSV